MQFFENQLIRIRLYHFPENRCETLQKDNKMQTENGRLHHRTENFGKTKIIN